jgi:dipeptidyl aminopeptidase/acylaminoacyl peptidase
MNRHLAAAVLSLLLIPAALHAQNRQPITHEALFLMKRVGRPVVSPDGRTVVFDVTEPAYDEKEEIKDLWIVPSDGSTAPRRLTATKGGESDAEWSPDGKRIAFAAKREGDEVNQIYVLDLAGGDPVRVTTLPMSARSPRFSPDGKMLLFMSAVYPGASDLESNRRIAKERKEAKSKVRIYDSFPVRRWDRWLDDTQTHVFVVPVEGGTPRDLLAGTELVKSGFGGRTSEGSTDTLDPAWSPDGRSIIFSATTNRTDAAWAAVRTDLFEVPLTGGEPRRLTSGPLSFYQPQFRPDGRGLCFKQNAEEKTIYSLDRLACAPWPWSGSPKTITADSDRSVGTFAFTPDSKTIYFTAEDSGLEKIYAVPVSGGGTKLALSPERGVYTSLTIPEKAASPILFANWETAINPREIVRIDLGAKSHRLITAFNVAAANAIDWQPLRHFTFTNSLGRQVHNMIALPPNFDETKKYPLLVLIHGGAHNMWRDSITYRWNYHLLAAPGYVVLLTDYRGSTGYGEQFALDILRDPLKGPAEDVNQGADEAIKRFPFIDGARQAAAGASYGGHLANWLEGTTTRYKALISHAGLASLESQWGTSDTIYHRELMVGGPPWANDPIWREHSPIAKAANFKTPMLLSVGENDYRVPLNQTLEMWSALQRMRVPSRLLVWSDENHWILKGENSRVFYREVHDWLAKWVK